MTPRQNEGRRPQITFTSDFHELVQGDLVPGPCVLRYDPLRLIPGEAAHEESHTLHAHVRFHPSGQTWEGAMVLPPSNVPLDSLADPAAQGLMLETSFSTPPDCNELEVWFSCAHPDGTTHWDSDFGRNHWLRFSLHDIEIVQAKVRAAAKKTAPQDAFELELATVGQVDCVDVRWRLSDLRDFPRQIAHLAPGGVTAGRKRWLTPTGGLPVPKGSTVIFDVVYSIAGRKFTDDNQGRWYIADGPARS